jgi:hypothetical protein
VKDSNCSEFSAKWKESDALSKPSLRKEAGAHFSLQCKKSVAMAQAFLGKVGSASILPATAHVLLHVLDTLKHIQPKS